METSQAFSILGFEISSGLAFGALAFAIVLFAASFYLVLKTINASVEARIARTEAEVKLSAAKQLSAEVSRLRAQVEEAVLHHNSAVANAFLMHNDACAATRSTPVRAAAPGARGSLLGDAGGHGDHHHEDHSDDHGAHQGLRIPPSSAGGRQSENAAAFRARARAESLSGSRRAEHEEEGRREEPASFLKGFFQRTKARQGASWR